MVEKKAKQATVTKTSLERTTSAVSRSARDHDVGLDRSSSTPITTGAVGSGHGVRWMENVDARANGGTETLTETFFFFHDLRSESGVFTASSRGRTAKGHTARRRHIK